MRLFTAINLTPDIKQTLKYVQDSCLSNGVRGNYIPEENLHLTLAFIGDYPDPDHILEVMEIIRSDSFSITIDGLGNFDDIWWAGLHPSQMLTKTVSRLRKAFSDYQIPYDRRKFAPHITLIRKADIQNAIPVFPIKPITMNVDHLSLMRSDRGKNQMIYTEIGSVDL